MLKKIAAENERQTLNGIVKQLAASYGAAFISLRTDRVGGTRVEWVERVEQVEQLEQVEQMEQVGQVYKTYDCDV